MAKPRFLSQNCPKKFLNESKFNAHVKVHAKQQALKCNLCDKEFISRSKLNVHIKYQHEGFRYTSKKHFKCSLCGLEICSENQLIDHMRTHTGERPFKCTVNECGKAFKLELTLKNHIKYKHSDERPLTCKFPGCPFTTKTDVSLIAHLKKHSDRRPFACQKPGCDFRARERSHMTRHVKSVHSEAKPFACSECGYQTARSDSLKSHMQRHAARRDFKCSHPDCSESFKSSLDLTRHFSNRHGERNFLCDQLGCWRKYANANALYKHKWNVHSRKSLACAHLLCGFSTNKPEKFAAHLLNHERRKVSCSITGCEYKGKHSTAARLHMRRHHQVLLKCSESACSRYKFTKAELKDHTSKFHNPLGRPFQYPLCFKCYPTQDKLQRHTSAHTREKPYKCGHCDFGTCDRYGLKKHVLVGHADLKFPFIVLPPDERECLRCKVTLPVSEFIIHSMSHAVPVVMIERMEISCSWVKI